MKFKWTIRLFAVLFGTLVTASAIAEAESVRLVKDAGLSNPEAWSGLDGSDRRLVAGAGRNQTSALEYSRQEPGSYELVGQTVKLEGGALYRFGAWLKTDGMISGEGAGICLEVFDAAGNYLAGHYAAKLRRADDWMWVEDFLELPNPGASLTGRLVLYMRPGAVGRAWFDDVELKRDAGTFLAAQMWPTRKRIFADTGAVRLSFHLAGNFTVPALPAGAVPKWAVKVELCRDDRVEAEQLLPGVPSPRAELVWGKLAPGAAELRIALMEQNTGWVAARQSLPVSIEPAATGRVDFSADGRTMIDGEAFFPLGVYVGGLTRDEITEIAEAGFNCVMPYQSPFLRFNPAAPASEAALREVLDACDAQGVKVLFSLKDIYPEGMSAGHVAAWNGVQGYDAVATALVEAFRTHPALLAWYICDEAQLDFRDAMAARRDLVNRLDPDHPTWSVFYQTEALPYFQGTMDILGVDPYPIWNQSSRHMHYVDEMSNAAQLTGIPQWSVPQMHNLGIYAAEVQAGNQQAYFDQFRDPSEEEMLAMALREVWGGSRGLVFYSYFDLKNGPDRGQFARRWPEIKRMVAALRLLTPFFLSEKAPTPLTLQPATATVKAMRFELEDGTSAVIITASGPGAIEGTLETGVPGLISHTGRSTEITDGVYRFRGEDISCDILLPAAGAQNNTVTPK